MTFLSGETLLSRCQWAMVSRSSIAHLRSCAGQKGKYCSVCKPTDVTDDRPEKQV